MTSTKSIEDIKHIIHISTRFSQHCEHCDKFGSMSSDLAVNHYIENHGYKLLHIGAETQQNEAGDFFNCTAFVIGK
jgi:hypothetical protein